MTDATTLQARLAEAEEALHRLLTGTAAVRLRFQERDTWFEAGDAGRLRSYIGELKAQLGLGKARQGARRVVFG